METAYAKNKTCGGVRSNSKYMSKSEIIKFLILRSIGNFLVLFGIFGAVATFGPVVYAEAQFRIAQARGVRYTVAEPQTSPLGVILEKQREQKIENDGFAALLSGEKERVLVPESTDFGIVIPKIGANAKVIPNVDPTNQDEFLPILQQGVAHARGTVFPGMKGNIYLFAHSTDNFWNVGRYNAVFYLLKDLTVGDEIVMFFENRRYNYIIEQSVIANPEEVSLLVDNQRNEERLILQTCWPPGTTWKRLFIIAKPKVI